MKCPQCGVDTPEDALNCVSCHINLHWASRHYADLAQVRERQGRGGRVPSPPFLIKAHESAIAKRAGGGGGPARKARAGGRKASRDS
jgi:hypothetical protein